MSQELASEMPRADTVQDDGQASDGAALDVPEIKQTVVDNAASLILAKKIKRETRPKKPIEHSFHTSDLVLDMPKPLNWDTMTSASRLNEKHGEQLPFRKDDDSLDGTKLILGL